jgi:hypothetical protein
MTASFRDGARISGGARDLTEYVRAFGDATMRDAGILPPGYKLHPGVQDLGCRPSVADLARSWFDSVGITSWRGKQENEIVQTAIRVSREVEDGRRDIGSGTETFNDLLLNVANGSFLLGWSSVRSTWRDLFRTIIVQDFRPTPIAGPSEIQLSKLGPGGEIAHTPAGDRYEQVTPTVHAAIFSLSREAQLNDFRGALVVDAKRAAEAADARINQECFAMLALASGAGPTLIQTGRALFNVTDGTLASSAAALSVTTMNAGRKAVRVQKDPTSLRRLNIAARRLLVPPSLEETGRVLVASDNIPGDPDNLRLLVDAELEATSSTAFFLLADPNVNDSLACAFQDAAMPTLESKYNMNTDGLEYKVRIVFSPVVTDFRGCWKNAGAGA